MMRVVNFYNEQNPFSLNEVCSMKLKKEDLKEIFMFGHKSSYEAIKISIDKSSQVNIIHNENYELIAIFGLSIQYNIENEEVGMPWLLTTDKIDTIKLPISRYAKNKIHKEYINMVDSGILFNYVSKTNKQSIDFLKFIGFEFEEHNEDSYLFFIEKNKIKIKDKYV